MWIPTLDFGRPSAVAIIRTAKSINRASRSYSLQAFDLIQFPTVNSAFQHSSVRSCISLLRFDIRYSAVLRFAFPSFDILRFCGSLFCGSLFTDPFEISFDSFQGLGINRHCPGLAVSLQPDRHRGPPFLGWLFPAQGDQRLVLSIS